MRDLGQESRLIVGPWTRVDFVGQVGVQDFGIMASRDAGEHPHGSWSGEVLAFLRRQLSYDTAPDPSPPMRIFVMGTKVWRDEAAWPLERARTERWNLRLGGVLSTSALPEEPAPSEVD